MVTTNSSVQDLVERVSQLTRDTNSKEEEVLRLTRDTVVSAIQILVPVTKYLEQNYSELDPNFKFKTPVRGIYLGNYRIRRAENADEYQNFPVFLTRGGGGGKVQVLNQQNSEICCWRVNPLGPTPRNTVDVFVADLSEDELMGVLENAHEILLSAIAKLQDRFQSLQEREQKIRATQEILRS